MQTGQDDCETEPEAGEGEEPQPSDLGKRRVLSDRWKESGKGNHSTTDEIACGQGHSDIGGR